MIVPENTEKNTRRFTSVTARGWESGQNPDHMAPDTKWDWSLHNHDEWNREDLSAPHPQLMNGIIYTYLAKEAE